MLWGMVLVPLRGRQKKLSQRNFLREIVSEKGQMSLFILRPKNKKTNRKKKKKRRWINDYVTFSLLALISRPGTAGESAEPQHTQHRHYNIHLGGDEMFMLRQKMCSLFNSDTAIWPSDGNITISFGTRTEMIRQKQKVQQSSCN